MNDIICEYKKIHEFEIVKHYIAGIVLESSEIKSLLNGSCSLQGAYISVNYLSYGVHIYKMFIKNTDYKIRILLLNKKEIIRLHSYIKEGYTIIPIKLFKINNLIKVDVGICRKLKKHESKKRDKIRKIDISEARKYGSIKINIT